MSKKTPTQTLVEGQLAEYGIEFGERYRDKASGFEGQVTALYFFEHGCLRVNLRGTDRQTGAPVEATFDAPELIKASTQERVPAGSLRGGPHGLASPAGARPI